MAIGDSITAGFGPTFAGGWRAALSALAPNIVWTGRLGDPPGASTFLPTDNATHVYGLHEGYNGLRTDQIRTQILAAIPALLPVTAMLMCGVNDIVQGETGADTITEVVALAVELRTLGVRNVVVCNIVKGGTATVEIGNFNSGIAAAVAAAGDPQIVFCDATSTMSAHPSADFADSLHPSTIGYQTKIAPQAFASLTALGLIPSTPY